METKNIFFDKFRHCVGRRTMRVSALIIGWLFLQGCGVLSSSFLTTLDPLGTGLGASSDVPSGFIVIAFVNNAEIDEQLVNYLVSGDGGGLQLTDEEQSSLRPRVKLTVRITYRGGRTLDAEFISGSRGFVEPRFFAESAPDLNQVTNDNVVATFDIVSVALSPDSPIEVFIPVELTQLQLVEVTGEGGQTLPEFQVRGLVPPQFRELQIDGTDDDIGGRIRQNIGVEDLMGPVRNPLCGSFIGISFGGTLSVPFHPSRAVPSFDLDDPNQVGAVGGRFEFRVTIG